MTAIFEAKIHIMKAETLDALNQVVELFCETAGYHQYNSNLDYAANALLADTACRYGIAELLRLAAKRERVLL